MAGVMKGETGVIVLMDRLVVAVLKQAEVAEHLPDKIAAGALVAQWIWVKHRLGYGEDVELPSLGDLRAAVAMGSAGAELS